MDTGSHNLHTLFAQLGLGDTPDAVDAFVAAHQGLDENTALPDADFWAPAQATFLREALDDDAEWAEAVDQLDAMLRK